MNLDKVYVCDCETDGFLESVTKVHVFGLGWLSGDTWKVKATPKHEDMIKILTDPENTLVFHNGYSYDKPALEKILGIEVKAYIIDTLYVSWVLFPNRFEYGLDSFGKDYGIAKPKIDDWENLTYEEYAYRVSEDVKINIALWDDCLKYLRVLYNGDEEKIKTWLKFVNAKAINVADQEKFGIKLDLPKAHENFEILDKLRQDILDHLIAIMPKVPVKKIKKKPANCYKKDGSLSKAGETWYTLLRDLEMDPEFNGELELVVDWVDPNPGSVDQIKAFLFSKGWKPAIYKESIGKYGTTHVPQLRDKDKNLCKSILALTEDYPELIHLEKLSVIQHRLGIVKGFLRDSARDGYLRGRVNGLTATLRLRHKELVNMPKPSVPYGEYIRSLLICEEDEVLLGTDLSSLENYTRTHFTAPIQPEAVEILKDPDYDSHTQLAIFAGMMTPEEETFFKWMKYKDGDERKAVENLPEQFKEKTEEERDHIFHKLNIVRNKAKTTSYSALYGVGKKKLAKELKISEDEAAQLLGGYWKLNFAVKLFAETCKVKTVRGQDWVLNPLNGFWYELRSEKDIFSVVNQSAGDYCFTVYLMNIRHFLEGKGVVVANFHDEALIRTKKEDADFCVEAIKKAIARSNKQLKLNVPLGMDYALGKNYAEVH